MNLVWRYSNSSERLIKEAQATTSPIQGCAGSPHLARISNRTCHVAPRTATGQRGVWSSQYNRPIGLRELKAACPSHGAHHLTIATITLERPCRTLSMLPPSSL
jgi:hypothetical protein